MYLFVIYSIYIIMYLFNVFMDLYMLWGLTWFLSITQNLFSEDIATIRCATTPFASSRSKEHDIMRQVVETRHAAAPPSCHDSLNHIA